MDATAAQRRLMAEYKQLVKDGPQGITAGPRDEKNLLEWNFILEGPPDTPYEDGLLPGRLTFPRDYPLQPPVMRFTCTMFHPNVYKDGTVCISILHPPEPDKTGYEELSERWSPVQTVEKILVSVLSMLAEPNDESGANIDACKMWRENRKEYNRTVRRHVRETLDIY